MMVTTASRRPAPRTTTGHTARPPMGHVATWPWTSTSQTRASTLPPSLSPAGRRVQLLLRNRSVTEHHDRVLGLVPDDLLWVSEPESVVVADVLDEQHHHHARDFVPWRATSPSGIRPTGREAHLSVTPARGVDVVLFTVTNTGTFVVQCDPHGEHTTTRPPTGRPPKSPNC